MVFIPDLSEYIVLTSLPRKSVVRLTDRPDMTLDVYRGRKHKYNNNKLLKMPVKQIITATVKIARLLC